MAKLEPLSPLEWQIFAALCQNPPKNEATSVWLRERVSSRAGHQLALQSLIALLDRLVAKGWVRKEADHSGSRALRNLYFPIVSHDEGLATQVRYFLDAHDLQPDDVRPVLDQISSSG